LEEQWKAAGAGQNRHVCLIIARFETLSGVDAIHVATGLSFAELRSQRAVLGVDGGENA